MLSGNLSFLDQSTYMLTVQEIKESLPVHLKTAATQELTDKVNQIAQDPEAARDIRENFISYIHVLKEGKFKTEDYLNAVAYVSYKIMGYTNQESYKRVFPQRYQAQVAKGASDKDISAYVAAYNKGKLVNLILEQTLVPSWVLNQDIYQKAINVQAELMLSAASEKVRAEAANSLLTHLKKPESKQVELSIGVEDTSGMNELKDMLSSLAQRQQDLIGQGMTTREIAHQDLHTKKTEVIETVDVIAATAKDVTPHQTTAQQKPKSPASTKTNLGDNPLTSFTPTQPD